MRAQDPFRPGWITLHALGPHRRAVLDSLVRVAMALRGRAACGYVRQLAPRRRSGYFRGRFIGKRWQCYQCCLEIRLDTKETFMAVHGLLPARDDVEVRFLVGRAEEVLGGEIARTEARERRRRQARGDGTEQAAADA